MPTPPLRDEAPSKAPDPALATAERAEPDAPPSSPAQSPGASSRESQPVAVAPSTLEPYARPLDDRDAAPAVEHDRRARSPWAYVGIAAALVLLVGGIAAMTRAPDSVAPASAPAAEGHDEPRKATPAKAGTDEAVAPKAVAPAPAAPETKPEPEAAPPSEPSEPSTAAEPEAAEAEAAEAETQPGASAKAEASSPTPPSGPVTVTIHATPPDAIIYDEKQRIGKGTARIVMRPGRKRAMLALLNLHHPKHFVIDGSETTVNVTLERMDESAIARSISVQKRKAASQPAPAKRKAR